MIQSDRDAFWLDPADKVQATKIETDATASLLLDLYGNFETASQVSSNRDVTTRIKPEGQLDGKNTNCVPNSEPNAESQGFELVLSPKDNLVDAKTAENLRSAGVVKVLLKEEQNRYHVDIELDAPKEFTGHGDSKVSLSSKLRARIVPCADGVVVSDITGIKIVLPSPGNTSVELQVKKISLKPGANGTFKLEITATADGSSKTVTIKSTDLAEKQLEGLKNLLEVGQKRDRNAEATPRADTSNDVAKTNGLPIKLLLLLGAIGVTAVTGKDALEAQVTPKARTEAWANGTVALKAGDEVEIAGKKWRVVQTEQDWSSLPPKETGRAIVECTETLRYAVYTDRVTKVELAQNYTPIRIDGSMETLYRHKTSGRVLECIDVRDGKYCLVPQHQFLSIPIKNETATAIEAKPGANATAIVNDSAPSQTRNTNNDSSRSAAPDLKPGDVVKYGRNDWKVLQVDQAASTAIMECQGRLNFAVYATGVTSEELAKHYSPVVIEGTTFYMNKQTRTIFEVIDHSGSHHALLTVHKYREVALTPKEILTAPTAGNSPTGPDARELSGEQEAARVSGSTGGQPSENRSAIERRVPPRTSVPSADGLRSAEVTIHNDGTLTRHEARTGDTMSVDELRKQTEVTPKQIKMLEMQIRNLRRSLDLDDHKRADALEHNVKALKGELGPVAHALVHRAMLDQAIKLSEGRRATGAALGVGILASAGLSSYIETNGTPAAPRRR